MVAATALLPATAHAGTKLAIIPLIGVDAQTRKMARSLTRHLTRTLRRTRPGRRARLFPRSKSARLLRCVQQAPCLKRLGSSTGASHFVAGQVARLGSRYHIDLWLLSVEQGGIARSGNVRAKKTKTLRKRLLWIARRIVSRLPAADRRVAKQRSSAAKKRRAAKSAEPDEKETIETPAWVRSDGADGGSQSIWRKLSFWAWISGGVTTVMLSTAIGFGIASLVAKGNAKDAVFQGEAAIEQDAAQKNALAANVLFGISGALAVTSGVLFYLAYRPTAAEGAQSGLPLRVAITPVATNHGASGAALTVGGRF